MPKTSLDQLSINALRILAIGIVRPRRRQHLTPADDGNLLAHGRQRLTAARELRYRPVELMVREELREVMSADQPVDGQFLLAVSYTHLTLPTIHTV